MKNSLTFIEQDDDDDNNNINNIVAYLYLKKKVDTFCIKN